MAVVVNYGSHELLARNLASTSTGTKNLGVRVVDNFSTRAERLAVEALASQHGWEIVAPEDNLGFGSGVNLALVDLDASVDSIILLNPDASLNGAALDQLVAHARAFPDTLVGPRLLRVDGSQASHGSDLLLRRGEMRGWHHRPKDADPASYQPWLSGACLALSRGLWEAIGGFDDDYFLYWEDVDLARRVLDAGGRLRLLPDVTVVHDEGATHRGGVPMREKSPTYYYWNARNRLVFAGKHLSPADQRRWLRTSLGAGYRLLLQGGRRQLRHPSRTIVPVLKGIRDGRRAMGAR